MIVNIDISKFHLLKGGYAVVINQCQNQLFHIFVILDYYTLGYHWVFFTAQVT